ncbi:hypothetical protein KKJ06_18450 [Xenorhabdus bovienii]|uniref:hypothetical protein n=1 Tax=Xenorhabdus bovienii TaxID=40576 RepID=UPI0023B31B7F|nr:hypothetical protein [Xenorhabdus bovienii]MDE9447363.1 hypothetical protein [Xenorhabdus bovienii]MDE9552774.1 hypothetical protein [Xenorhabdus bovienii]MDE9557344.1 hypothetical protein [Xenorhabdus bovienii]
MSDKKHKKSEAKDFKPYVDSDNSISVKDFFDYLKDKEVSVTCPACGKPTMSGIVAVEKNQSLTLNVMSKDASKILAHECVGRICLLCGNVQLFWTNSIRAWVKGKNNKDSN